MGLGQEREILNNLVVTLTKVSTPYVLYENEETGRLKMPQPALNSNL